MTLNLMDVFFRVKNFILYLIATRKISSDIASSPIISEFVQNILHDQTDYADFSKILREKRNMMNATIRLPVGKFGAARTAHVKTLTLHDVIRGSSISEKHGKLLYRMSRYYKPASIIELGTAAGLSTLYLALGNPAAKVVTIEANPILSGVASAVFKRHHLNHIELMNCSFEDALPLLKLDRTSNTMIFIDGNHTYEATRKYFDFFIANTAEPYTLILHDINWSRGMKRIWNEVRSDLKVKTTIDIYYLGIVYNFRHLQKQHIVMRY